uniref:Uncharacterized protein n=1 Tax=Solanum tuberosum TaxID=4113 RepID=M1DUP4_SOLTU
MHITKYPECKFKKDREGGKEGIRSKQSLHLPRHQCPMCHSGSGHQCPKSPQGGQRDRIHQDSNVEDVLSQMADKVEIADPFGDSPTGAIAFHPSIFRTLLIH